MASLELARTATRPISLMMPWNPLRRRRPAPRRPGTIYALMLLGTVAMISPFTIIAPAYASSCPQGQADSHVYSEVSYCSGPYAGVEGQWGNEWLGTSDQSDYNDGFELNNEFWTFTASDQTVWVEIGLTNNANIWGKDPCGCTAYYAFWADNNPNLGGIYEYYISNLSPDNSNHVYETLNVSGSNTNWTVWFDYANQGTSTHQVSSTAPTVNNGLELYDGGDGDYYTPPTGPPTYGQIDPDESTVDPYNGILTTFNNYVQVEQTNGTWIYPSADNTYFTYPCGTYANGYCMNGSPNSAGEWSDNVR
jgi:hypothetical protein